MHQMTSLLEYLNFLWGKNIQLLIVQNYVFTERLSLNVYV